MELPVPLNARSGITIHMVTDDPNMTAYARRVIHFVDGRTSVAGTTNAYFQTSNRQLASGRTFEDAEEKVGAAVCLIGNQRVSTLLVSLNDDSDSERVRKSFTQLLRARRKLAAEDDDTFNVLDTRQIAEALSCSIRRSMRCHSCFRP